MGSSTRGRHALAVPALLVVAALAVAAVGCSSGKKETSTTATTAGGPPGTSAAAEPAGVAKITIKVKEDGSTYTFDAPSSVPAGWVEVTLENDGKLSHQAGIGHPTGGTTAADLVSLMKDKGPDPSALANLALDGGPNGVAAGQTQKVIVKLDPGEHVVYCFVSDLTDGKSHAQHGMVATLNVTGGATTGTTVAGATSATTIPATTEPDPVATVGTIEMQDYSFALPKGFGEAGWYKIVDNGPQPHELTLLKLASGATPDQAKAALLASLESPSAGTTATTVAGATATTAGTVPSGPPPFTEAGGMGAMGNGQVGYLYVDLASGGYVATCFVPDIPYAGRSTAPDFKPHIAHGMFDSFTVS